MEANSVFIAFLIIFICSAATTADPDSSKKDYCPYTCGGYKNIGCNNPGTFSCKGASVIELTSEHINSILHQINDNRNAVANNSIPGSTPCKRCATVTWDNDLAYLSRLRTLKCKSYIDECAYTDKFNATGQSYSIWGSSADYLTKDVISTSIKKWFDQYKTENCSNSDNMCKLETDNDHTQMIRGNATAMGCAAAKSVSGSFYWFYFVCTYSNGNFYGSTVYTPGSPASGCTTGKNPKYPALCSTNEVIDANSIINPGNPAKCWANYTNTAPSGSTTKTDYCKYNCGSEKHTACNVTQDFGPKCRNAEIVNFNQNDKDYILFLHNTYRNGLCNGSVPGYPQCAQSATMVWDEDLAYVAGQNTRRCEMIHDECRVTGKWRFVGQNLAQAGYMGRFLKTRDFIYKSIKLFNDEWKYADGSYLQPFKFNSDPNKVIAHYSQMTWANSTAVGCGATHHFDGKFFFTLLGCNYAGGNFPGATWYFAGKSGSKCKTGTNPKFPALCSEKEPLDANSYYFPKTN